MVMMSSSCAFGHSSRGESPGILRSSFTVTWLPPKLRPKPAWATAAESATSAADSLMAKAVIEVIAVCSSVFSAWLSGSMCEEIGYRAAQQKSDDSSVDVVMQKQIELCFVGVNDGVHGGLQLTAVGRHGIYCWHTRVSH